MFLVFFTCLSLIVICPSVLKKDDLVECLSNQSGPPCFSRPRVVFCRLISNSVNMSGAAWQPEFALWGQERSWVLSWGLYLGAHCGFLCVFQHRHIFWLYLENQCCMGWINSISLCQDIWVRLICLYGLESCLFLCFDWFIDVTNVQLTATNPVYHLS